VAEFFAGVGLAKVGLEQAGARVVWANDHDPNKTLLYRRQHGAEHYVERDIAAVTGDDVPDVDIAWSSFPCTDLSLAGNRHGLSDGVQSSVFWQFVRVLHQMDGRRPPVVALENVIGLATSRGGDDLAQVIRALNGLGYSADVVTLDARRFVPQSRPRLFVVGAASPSADDAVDDHELRPDWLQTPFGDPSLRTHKRSLPAPPPPLISGFTRIADPTGEWWSPERTAAFLDSLSALQADRLDRLRRSRTIAYRTAYRRTRHGRATWEVRADDIAGCLRTARGGSSKQAVVRAGRGAIDVRWMSPREYARLMGAEDFDLSTARTNQSLFGFGDAVCVPVVSWLAEHYLLPLLAETHEGRSGELEAASGQ